MPEVDGKLLEEFKQSVLELQKAQDKAREYEAKIAAQEKRLDDLDRVMTVLKESKREQRMVELRTIDKTTKQPYRFSEGLVEWVGKVFQREAQWLRENYPAVKAVDGLGTSLLPDGSSTGAYTVPEGFWNEIWRVMVQRSIYLQECRALPMVTQTLLYPAIGDGWVVEWPDEGAAITQGEPTYGQIAYLAKKVASFGKVTKELEMFAAPDIMGDLLLRAAESVAKEIDRVGFNGAVASDVADGLLVWAGNNTPIATTTFTPTYQEIIDGCYKLTTVTLAGAKFIMSPSVFGKIKGLVDTQGSPIWVPTAGSPDSSTIVGFPYVLADHMPGLADENVSTPFMLFGNFNYIPYGDVRGFRFERSDEFLFQNDQIALKFTRHIAFPDITNAAEVPKTLVKWTTAAT